MFLLTIDDSGGSFWKPLSQIHGARAVKLGPRGGQIYLHKTMVINKVHFLSLAFQCKVLNVIPSLQNVSHSTPLTKITRFMGPTWGPPGSCASMSWRNQACRISCHAKILIIYFVLDRTHRCLTTFKVAAAAVTGGVIATRCPGIYR